MPSFLKWTLLTLKVPVHSLTCLILQGMHHHPKASPSLAGFPASLVTNPSLKAQMELLQQAKHSGHRANGSLDADLPTMRRRRGRRKNVEGLELLFMGNKRGGGVGSTTNCLTYTGRCSFSMLICIILIFPTLTFMLSG